MTDAAKKTKADRLAEKALKEQQRLEAIEALKQACSTPPPWISSAGIVRTRAWLKLAGKCQRMTGTRRVSASRLNQAIENLQQVETQSLDQLQKLITPTRHV